MEKFSASQRASDNRGSNSRCFPDKEPPSSPVTKMASPAFAPERRGDLPRVTVPSTEAEMSIRSGFIRLTADNGHTMPLGERVNARVNPLQETGIKIGRQRQRDQ